MIRRIDDPTMTYRDEWLIHSVTPAGPALSNVTC